MPVEIGLSKYALDLLCSRVDGGGREVDDSNREAYGELERAGIMYSVSGFVSGPECLFRWTDDGWKRRHEIIGLRYGGKVIKFGGMMIVRVEQPGSSPGSLTRRSRARSWRRR